MTPPPIDQSLVVFDNVSRFYGEVLGVNRVTSVDSTGHHQPGRPQRLRQDYAYEPDDCAGETHARVNQDPGRHSQ